jgi:hypothetical protein
MLIPFFVVVSCLTPASELTSAVSVNINTMTPPPYGNASTTVIDEAATIASLPTNWTESSTPSTPNISINVTTNTSVEPTTFNPYPEYPLPPTAIPTTDKVFPISEQPSTSNTSSTIMSHLPYILLNFFFGLCFFVLC